MPGHVGILGVPAVAGYSPAILSALALWFDASDASSFTFGTGNQVSQINDKSPNAQHITRTPSTNCTRDATLNGRSAVNFGNAVLTRANLQVQSLVDGTLRTNCMGAMVFTTHASLFSALQMGAIGGTYRAVIDIRQTPAYLDVANATGGRLTGNSNVFDGNTYLMSWFRNGASMAYRLNQVNQLTTAAASGSVAGSQLATFNLGNSAGGAFYGVFAEALWVADYNATDFADIELYLKTKWATP